MTANPATNGSDGSNWMAVCVADRRTAAEDVVAFTLVALPGAALPPFEAGAHVDVLLPGGIVRQYSLCGPPAQSGRYELGVLLERSGRGGSRAAHERIAAGDVIRIGRPRNLFALTPAHHALLLAGGIGITPILAMAEHLAATGESFELHYCARSRWRAAFIDRIEASAFASRARLYFDDGPADRLLQAERLLARPDPATHLYVCGPGGFIDHVTGTARAAGWSDENIHSERFAASTPAASTGDFDVVMACSGQVVPVAAGESVVAALAAHGVEIPVSCEQGICGTCVMRVLEGIPDHRDMILSDEERADRFTPCCSRALSARLVIDF